MWYSCIPQTWQDDSLTPSVIVGDSERTWTTEKMEQRLNSGGSRMRSNIHVREAPHKVKSSRDVEGAWFSRTRQGLLDIYIYKTVVCDRVLTLNRPCAYPGAVLRHTSGPTGPRSSKSFFVDQILAPWIIEITVLQKANQTLTLINLT